MAPTAHLSLIHPPTPSSRDALVSKSTSSSSSASTIVIFTPATRPKAMLGMVPPSEAGTLFGVLEISSSSSSLSTTLGSQRDVKVETSKWTQAAGFTAREGESKSPKAQIVMLAKFVLKGEGEEMEKNRKGLVEVLGNFCNWVESAEPGTLTYAVFVPTSATSNEVLMFERYADLPALGVHGKTAEFKNMFRGTGRFIQGRKTVLSEWEEREGSSVTRGEDVKAKL